MKKNLSSRDALYVGSKKIISKESSKGRVISNIEDAFNNETNVSGLVMNLNHGDLPLIPSSGDTEFWPSASFADDNWEIGIDIMSTGRIISMSQASNVYADTGAYDRLQLLFLDDTQKSVMLTHTITIYDSYAEPTQTYVDRCIYASGNLVNLKARWENANNGRAFNGPEITEGWSVQSIELISMPTTILIDYPDSGYPQEIWPMSSENRWGFDRAVIRLADGTSRSLAEFHLGENWEGGTLEFHGDMPIMWLDPSQYGHTLSLWMMPEMSFDEAKYMSKTTILYIDMPLEEFWKNWNEFHSGASYVILETQPIISGWQTDSIKMPTVPNDMPLYVLSYDNDNLSAYGWLLDKITFSEHDKNGEFFGSGESPVLVKVPAGERMYVEDPDGTQHPVAYKEEIIPPDPPVQIGKTLLVMTEAEWLVDPRREDTDYVFGIIEE